MFSVVLNHKVDLETCLKFYRQISSLTDIRCRDVWHKFHELINTFFIHYLIEFSICFFIYSLCLNLHYLRFTSTWVHISSQSGWNLEFVMAWTNWKHRCAAGLKLSISLFLLFFILSLFVWSLWSEWCDVRIGIGCIAGSGP